MNRNRFALALAFVVLFTSLVRAEATSRKTEYLILITLDGVRTQELFGGADATLINKQNGGVRQVDEINRRFMRQGVQDRREALMPFMWKTIAKEGQIFGDREKESAVTITNRRYFSYPGYNEILAGFADPKIDSNDKKYNENKTVLEFLHEKDRFKGKVEAYACWDVFPFIINTKRSGIPVTSAFDPPYAKPTTERQKLINATAAAMPPIWGGVSLDVFTFYPALDAIGQGRVSVLYVAFGETDDWAHDRRYDCYLNAAHQADNYIAQLWAAVQANEKYRNKTSLLITTDHGRGDNPANWITHGDKARTSEFGWIAVLGPDTPALGVREKTPVTQSQFAATAAMLVGEDFNRVDERIAKPLDVVK